MKIRTKITAALGIMTLLVSGILAVVMVYSITGIKKSGSTMLASLEKNIEDNVNDQLNSLAGDVSNFASTIESEIDLNMLNAANVLYEADRLTAGRLTLADLERLKTLTQMSDLYLAGNDGVFTISTEQGSIGMSLYDIWDGYRMLVTGEASYLPSDLKVKVETGEIFKFTAISRADNRGVLQSALNASAIESHLQKFIDFNDSIKSMNLFDSSLLVLTENSANGVTPIYTKGAQVPPGTTPIDAFFKGSLDVQITLDKDDARIYYPIMNGTSARYVLFIDLDPASYFALGKQVEAPVGDLIDQSAHSSTVSLILVIVVLALFTVVIYIMISRILKPLGFFNSTLASFSEGNFAITVPPEYAKGNDEMGEMAKSFGNTLEKMKHLITTILSQSKSLQSIGHDLAENMESTSHAVNGITANIQDIKGKVINQSASVSETNATMQQVTGNIEKLNGHVENQSRNISQASSAIEEMVANIQSVTQTLVKNSGNVKELMNSSEVGRTGLQDVSQDIQEIAKESEGLFEINSVMENIASQTNLLSMNAAIEAAHAGEAGKGFAVVAGEIRKLAESSSTQSKTISAVLKKIKESIDKITRSTQNVLNKFEAIDTCIKTVAEQEENIRSAMEEQGTGSQQLLQGVGNVNDITKQVSSGSSEMLEGAKEVIKEGVNLEKVTSEISTGMNEMASGADQINMAVSHINEISGKNRENINNLVQEVSRFKV